VYDPAVVSPGIIFGLKSLMSLFPASALIIGIIILIFYPLGRKQVQELQANLNLSKKINEEKLQGAEEKEEL